VSKNLTVANGGRHFKHVRNSRLGSSVTFQYRNDIQPVSANAAIDFNIMNNTFRSVYKGLDLSALENSFSISVVFRNNDFQDATQSTDGISFQVDGITIDARDNWFGSNTAPYNSQCNPDGQGATIHASGDNILYRPWCGTEDCSVLITQRSACAAGDDPSSFIQDEADSMSPWGMSILIISVCSVGYLVLLVIFFFALKLRQASGGQRVGSDQDKLT